MQLRSLGLIRHLLKIFYQLLYHQFAWTYDLVARLVSVGQWDMWVAAALPFISGERVLELGHGTGHLQILANKNRANIIGLDLSPQMGKICQKRLGKHEFSPKLIIGSGVSLPVDTESVSTVVATFPSEYIILPETLAQIHRVLMPGGRFVLIPLAWITGASLRHRLAAWLFRVTGQSVAIDNPVLEIGLSRIQDAGFITETPINDLEHSKVLILVAHK